ncbi:MAG: 2Fe-2S iron-sulfur cluster binding domain-containing protein [Alphaproteobacteria bacterium]|nr:MAG: 2Fe-2S iron-sulfur cluster binding domain-containing protein [Alphaproteobacteria bacterium]
MPESKKKPESEESNKEAVAQTRRSFLRGIGVAGAAGVAASLSPLSAVAAPGLPEEAKEPVAPDTNVTEQSGAMVSGLMVPVTLKVNGKSHRVQIDPRASLLDTLRETIHLTGTKKGCDHGQCGACTVHINGKRANSCLSLAMCNQGDEITTIEGLGTPEKMHPMQAAFVEHDGYQCGYCTSGQIMSAVALMKEPCGSDDAAVKELMSGNICRCGAYANIVDAIQQVRKAA